MLGVVVLSQKEQQSEVKGFYSVRTIVKLFGANRQVRDRSVNLREERRHGDWSENLRGGEIQRSWLSFWVSQDVDTVHRLWLLGFTCT